MKAIILILFVLVAGNLAAQSTNYFNTKGVAIQGYDPVAYFKQNAPVKGDKKFVYKWEGSDWYFASQENLDAFKTDPARYAPQFGGFCAYGVSEDHKSPTEPDAFTIVDDKLYLNYNAKVLELWRKDMKGRIAKAETNWIKLKDKE
jgi:YHS domain-containing protein